MNTLGMNPCISVESGNFNENHFTQSLNLFMSSLKGQPELPKDNINQLRELNACLSNKLKEAEKGSTSTIEQSPPEKPDAEKSVPRKRGVTERSNANRKAMKNNRGEPKKSKKGSEVTKEGGFAVQGEIVSLDDILRKEIPKMPPGTLQKVKKVSCFNLYLLLDFALDLAYMLGFGQEFKVWLSQEERGLATQVCTFAVICAFQV